MPPSDNKPQILSTAQTAAEFNISPRTLLHWIASGRIVAIKTGPGTAGYVFTRTEIDRVKAESTARAG